MKEVKQYKCEYCGTLYADKSECAACEKQHAVPCKIVAVHHRAKGVCVISAENRRRFQRRLGSAL